MNIKSTLIGAFIALIVTVIGGLVVYYITYKETKGENLTYWYDAPAIFEKDSSSVVLQTFNISNQGDIKSNGIAFEINYPEGIYISEKSVVFSSGNMTEYKDSITGKRNFMLQTPILLPKETIKISFILKSKSYRSPIVTLKSDSSLGTKLNINEKIIDKKSSIIKYYLLLLLALLVLLLILLYKQISRIRNYGSRQSSNNTAFLFIHKNLPDYAVKLLDKTIMKSGADGYILGNYALAKAIKGDFEESQKLIEAANFYSSGEHEKAVNLFNTSLVYFLKGELLIARKKLEEAVIKDAKEIKSYVEFSDLIKKIRMNNEIDSIFTELIK
jgi:tetratricopeptide (TPR) repeat protein